MNEPLYVQLRTALDASGISRAQAAERMGCTANNLDKMLAGAIPVNAYWAHRIADLTGHQVVTALTEREAR